MKIKEAFASDTAIVAMLVSEGNKDVAVKFGLNADNCPKHPSFCSPDWVAADMRRGERYFVLEEEGQPVACVAYETPNVDLAYLNRLSVLPAYRRRGYGALLVRHVVEHARADSIPTISIGVIGEHFDLQRWYTGLGFVAGDSKRFAHLPFSVRYMSLSVQGG
jgi:ribosomal protein S18 acetylase RimI-like enzyme